MVHLTLPYRLAINVNLTLPQVSYICKNSSQSFIKKPNIVFFRFEHYSFSHKRTFQTRQLKHVAANGKKRDLFSHFNQQVYARKRLFLHVNCSNPSGRALMCCKSTEHLP